MKGKKHRNILPYQKQYENESVLTTTFLCRGYTMKGREDIWRGYHSSIISEPDNSYFFFEEEPNNPHDPDAIKVVCGGEMFGAAGYVGREFTKTIKNILKISESYRIDIIGPFDASKKEQKLRLTYLPKAGMEAFNVLLIVDLQYGFMNEHTKKIFNKVKNLALESKESPWAETIDQHSKNPQKIDCLIATQFRNESNSLFEKCLGYLDMKASEDINIYDGFMVDKRFKKTGYGLTAEIIEYIKDEAGGREIAVYICGVDTEACVYSSALSLFDAGIRPVILADYCASSLGNKRHDAAIMLLESIIGKDQVIKGDVL